MDFYPDDPSLGSPFGTGNETFGLSPQFKQLAALSLYQLHINQWLLSNHKFTGRWRCFLPISTPTVVQCCIWKRLEDIRILIPSTDTIPNDSSFRRRCVSFTLPIRQIIKNALQVCHGAELPYVFGFDGKSPFPMHGATDEMTLVSKLMMDYWISFASSLNPNDGMGEERAIWPEYDIHSTMLQFDVGGFKNIKVTCRSSSGLQTNRYLISGQF